MSSRGYDEFYYFGFRVATVPALGDLNGDGHIDAADISAMEQALANPSLNDTSAAVSDINGDGVVNGADLQALLKLLKSGGGSNNSVPEPSTLVLAVLTALMVSGLSVRR